MWGHPEETLQRVKNAVSQGVRPDEFYEGQLYEAITGGDVTDKTVLMAYTVYQDTMCRELLTAMLITSEGTPAKIAEALDLDEPVVKMYSHLFFNKDALASRLHVMRYYNTEKSKVSNEGRAWLDKAYYEGFQSLCYDVLESERVDLDPMWVTKRVMADTLFRGRQVRGWELGTKASDDALRWLTQAVKSAEASKTLYEDDSDALDSLKIALESKDTSKSVEDAGISPDDIYH